MKSISQQAKSLTIAEALFAAPIILAYVIGSLPVLIPLLLLRRLLRPATPGVVEPPMAALAQPA